VFLQGRNQKVGVDRTLRGESRLANGRIRRRLAREEKRTWLVHAVELWPLGGRRAAPHEEGRTNLKIKAHLRFQRTLPSLASSNIIPRSASSLRIRSAAAKSRFFFAALRSATSRSTSASSGPLSGPPYPSARSFSPSLSCSTAKTMLMVVIISCTVVTSPCQNVLLYMS